MNSVLAPIHRAGWPFIGAFAVIAIALFFASAILGWLGVLATLWCAYFFRDPQRVTPVRDGLIVSPADGVVQSVGPEVPPPELGMDGAARERVSIFMNVFDVHVNRVPTDGKISRIAYRPGRFLNASLDKASEANERQAIRMTTADDRDLAFVQIAGLVARRIKCDLTEGQNVRTGERFGMIRFGSRVDVYLPEGTVPLVAVGQRMIAGETVIADARAQEQGRPGETR